MKTTVSGLKALLAEELGKLVSDNVDRERQGKKGYALADDGAGTDYGDVSETVDVAQEDTDRVRRHKDGYGDDLEEMDSCGPLAGPEKADPMDLLKKLAADPSKADAVKQVLAKLGMKPDALGLDTPKMPPLAGVLMPPKK